MGKIVKQRKLFVSKKAHYRQIAENRKMKWAERHQLQHQEQYKFHFCKSQNSEHNDHAGQNGKGDLRSEQKLKNRVAAQQSRQKRKYYLEEIEKKLHHYEALLQSQTCRVCLSVLKDKSQSEFGLSEQKASTKEQFRQDYFQEGLLRVDNEGVSTPFGIFFFLCFILILTIFTQSGTSMEHRMLSHNDPIIHSASPSVKQNEGVVSKQGHSIKQATNYFDITTKAVAQNMEMSKKIRENLLLQNNKDWKRYKNLICTTKLQLDADNQNKQSKKPFLSLRTKNSLKDNIPSQKIGQQSQQAEAKWDRDILKCIIYKPQVF